MTLGTVFISTSDDLFERLLAALTELNADVVVTIGRDMDPADFGPQPAHLRVERFLPQDDVLRAACKELIGTRFPDDEDRGAAAMLLADGTILTGTAPDAVNPSVEVCHEIEPYYGAFRLGQPVVASVCLHRRPDGRTIVLSPCGVCRERLAVHGRHLLVAVAGRTDATEIEWEPLKDVLPDY